MERPVGKYDEEEERWDGGDEEKHPEKPTIHLFILKWERTPRRAKDRPIFFYLIRKNEKKDRLGKHLPLSSDVVVPSLKFPDTGLAFGENGTLVKI